MKVFRSYFIRVRNKLPLRFAVLPTGVRGERRQERQFVMRPFIIVALGVSLFAVWSCEGSKEKKEELDIDAQVRLVVDEKLATRKTQRMESCREFALIEAEEIVDSMLMAQAKLTVSDTIGKPPKPPKPELLEVKKPKDNTPIKPLFDEKAIEEKTVKIESSKTKTIQQ